jgi:glycosyltransferase involved in cell wall biosynthesis
MSSIDVAIPNYNYGRFLRECVSSVQAQDVENLRILIVDNCSTDNSLDIARQLAAEDSRITVIAHDVNKGMHGSFNACIDWCTADYMTLLHADDLLPPGALRRARDYLDTHPSAVMTFGESVWTGERFVQLGPERWSAISGHRFIDGLCQTAANPVACAGVILRTSAQKAVGHYDPEISFAPDIEMWLRLALVGSIGKTSALQGIVRQHDVNASAYTRERLAAELKELGIAFDYFFAKAEAQGMDMSRRRAMLHQAMGERAYWAAIAHFLRGSYAGAKELRAMARELRRGKPFPPFQYVLKRPSTIGRATGSLRIALRRMPFVRFLINFIPRATR